MKDVLITLTTATAAMACAVALTTSPPPEAAGLNAARTFDDEAARQPRTIGQASTTRRQDANARQRDSPSRARADRTRLAFASTSLLNLLSTRDQTP